MLQNDDIKRRIENWYKSFTRKNDLGQILKRDLKKYKKHNETLSDPYEKESMTVTMTIFSTVSKNKSNLYT